MAATKTAAPAKSGASKPSAGSKAKAAGIIAAGGGPEDPVTDVLALGSLFKGSKPKGGDKFKPEGGDSSHAVKIGGSGSRLLLVEFLVCFVVLGLGTVVAPTGSKDGVPRLMSRGTGLCLLFFILSLASGAGAGAKKAAEGLGGLVTLAYLVTSTDAHDLFAWISGYYSKTGVAARVGSGLATAGGAAAGAAGAGAADAGAAGAAAAGVTTTGSTTPPASTPPSIWQDITNTAGE